MAKILRFSGFTDEWNEVTLNDVATFSKGKGISKNDISDYGIECVRYGELYTKYNEMIYNIESKTNLDKNELKLSEKDDILIPCSGETAIDLATASCIQKDQVAIGGDITVIKTDQYAPFITYYLNQKKTEIAKYAQGVSILHLYPKDFKVMNIKIPSITEQKKIIALLEEISKKERLLESKYQEYQDFKKFLMQQIFAQKLRFAEFEDEWIPYKIGDISETYSGGTPSTSKKEYYEGNIPFIKSGEINNNVTEQYITEDALKNSSAKKVQKGDLLLALYGATSGEVAISKIDGAINQAVLKIDNNMDNYFQYCYFLMYKDQIVHKYIQGGQGNLSANIIKKLEFKYPSLAEQKKISQFFMSFDNKLELYENKIIKYNNLKKGLLQQMFDYVHIILNFCVKICCIKYFLKS